MEKTQNKDKQNNSGKNTFTIENKKYRCEICDKLLSNKGSLKRHISNLHIIAPPRHTCPLCDRIFSRRDNRDQHCKRIHGIATEKFAKNKLTWTHIAEKPKDYTPPSEAISKQNKKRSDFFPHDDTLRQYSVEPTLINAESNDIPIEFKCDNRPPTPVLDEPLPAKICKVEKTKDTNIVWIKRSHLLSNRKYCTSKPDPKPLYIKKFTRKQNLPKEQRPIDFKARLIKQMDSAERIWSYESTQKSVTLITKKEIPRELEAEEVQPGTLPDEKELSQLERDLFLSDSESEEDLQDNPTPAENIQFRKLCICIAFFLLIQSPQFRHQ